MAKLNFQQQLEITTVCWFGAKLFTLINVGAQLLIIFLIIDVESVILIIINVLIINVSASLLINVFIFVFLIIQQTYEWYWMA